MKKELRSQTWEGEVTQTSEPKVTATCRLEGHMEEVVFSESKVRVIHGPI